MDPEITALCSALLGVAFLLRFLPQHRANFLTAVLLLSVVSEVAKRCIRLRATVYAMEDHEQHPITEYTFPQTVFVLWGFVSAFHFLTFLFSPGAAATTSVLPQWDSDYLWSQTAVTVLVVGTVAYRALVVSAHTKQEPLYIAASLLLGAVSAAYFAHAAKTKLEQRALWEFRDDDWAVPILPKLYPIMVHQ